MTDKYRVWFKSVPGFYEQYNGKVEVYAADEDEAIELALLKLRRGSFSDRDDSMWTVTNVEKLKQKKTYY